MHDAAAEQVPALQGVSKMGSGEDSIDFPAVYGSRQQSAAIDRVKCCEPTGTDSGIGTQRPGTGYVASVVCVHVAMFFCMHTVFSCGSLSPACPAAGHTGPACRHAGTQSSTAFCSSATRCRTGGARRCRCRCCSRRLRPRSSWVPGTGLCWTRLPPAPSGSGCVLQLCLPLQVSCLHAMPQPHSQI